MEKTGENIATGSPLTTDRKVKIVEGLVWTTDPNTGWRRASDGDDSEALLGVEIPGDVCRIVRRPTTKGPYEVWLLYRRSEARDEDRWEYVIGKWTMPIDMKQGLIDALENRIKFQEPIKTFLGKLFEKALERSQGDSTTLEEDPYLENPYKATMVFFRIGCWDMKGVKLVLSAGGLDTTIRYQEKIESGA